MRNIIDNFREYEEKLNKSKKTIDIYIKEAELFIKNYNINSIEDLKVLEDTDFLTNIWLNDMIKQYSVATVNKKKASLSVFSAFLILQGIIKENKIKQIENLKNDAIKTDIYSDDDIEKMINYLNNKIKENNFSRKVDLKVYKMQKCIIDLLITTGLRISEVVKMRIKDFNLDKSNIFMVRGKCYNDKVSRKNAFTEQVAEELREYLKIREEIKITEGDEEYLFISPLNHKHISEDSVRKFVKRMHKEIGIEGTLHEFRRTKGSNLVAKGIEIEKVAKFLGHQNSSTTERFYVKNVESVVESLVNL